MSAEAVVKKRGRPKKTVIEEAVVVLSSPPRKPTSSRKTTASKLTHGKTAKQTAISETASIIPENINYIVQNRDNPSKVPNTITSTSKRSAKKDVKKIEPLVPDSSTSLLVILRKADAFVRASRELTLETLKLVEIQEQSYQATAIAQPGAESVVETGVSKAQPRNQDSISQSNKTSGQLRPTPQSAIEEAAGPQSNFLKSFFNDPDPAPTPPPHLNEPATESESPGNPDVLGTSKEQSLHKPTSLKEVQSIEPTSKVDTLSRLPSVKPTSFTIRQSSVIPTVKSSPSMPPSQSRPASSRPPKSTQQSTSTARSGPYKQPPPIKPSPSSASRQPLSNTIPPASESLSYRSLPPRPTQLPYDQIKKNPQYRSLLWKYTGLMVGIPVLGVTSWQLWVRYQAQQNERKQTLGQLVGWESTRETGPETIGDLPTDDNMASPLLHDPASETESTREQSCR